MVVFMDKALMVFTTMMVLLLGEIDISIASIMCLSGCCTGVAFEAGLPIVPAMMVGLLVGAACGFFNGILLVAFPDLNSTIVTLGNQILFRGIAYMILEDKPITSISSKMSFLAWSKVAGIPLILIVFFVETLIFAFVIHRTKFGRSLYAIGSNAKASRFSGIKTNQIKVLVFTLSGLCAGFAGLFLISKLGSARASICLLYTSTLIDANGAAVNVAPFTPSSDIGMGIMAVKYAGEARAVILKHHGIMAYGSDMKEALYSAIYLEEAAKTFVLAKSMGAEIPLLDPEDIAKEKRGWLDYGQ